MIPERAPYTAKERLNWCVQIFQYSPIWQSFSSRQLRKPSKASSSTKSLSAILNPSPNDAEMRFKYWLKFDCVLVGAPEKLEIKSVSFSIFWFFLCRCFCEYRVGNRGYSDRLEMIYAELSGDFPLGDSRQPTYKSFGHLIWCLKTQTLLNSSMIIK